MPQELDHVVIRFAGDSGDGMQLTGGQFGTNAARQGNDIATLPDFPAEIRAPQGSIGGVSSFQVQFGDHNVLTPGEQVDVLVAMNPAALKVHLPALRKGGILITDEAEYNRRNLKNAGYTTSPLEDDSLAAWQLVSLNITKLTGDAVAEYGLGRKQIARTRNMLALGLVSWLYSRSIQPTLDWLQAKFAHQPDILAANIAALKAGENYAETAELIGNRYVVPAAHFEPGLYRQLSGHQAMSLGLVSAAQLAGLPLYLGAYPITPASDLLHELAKYRDYGVQVFQAEDEIAAIGAALGASYGGAIGVCSTSGPGFALKQEMLNLAVMTELPLVVIDVQRAGPSTGMPTKAEQSDLLQALWGRNGDSPLPVLAVSSATDSFDAAIEACRVAIEHRTPVVLLSDAYLANGSQPWQIPHVTKLPKINTAFATEPNLSNGDFAPYLRDEQTLNRPWAIPGTPGLEHRLGGLEKSNIHGNISYDPANHDLMTKLRAEHIARIPVPDIAVDDPSGAADVLVLGWGSTWGAITAACRAVRTRGYQVAQTHLRWLNPMPANLAQVLSGYRRVIVPEMNGGQLCHEIRARYLVNAESWSRVRGLPISESELADWLCEQLEAEQNA